MSGKKKFKPIITRIKLNPEQAVLSCCKVAGGKVDTTGTPGWNCRPFCNSGNPGLTTSS